MGAYDLVWLTDDFVDLSRCLSVCQLHCLPAARAGEEEARRYEPSQLVSYRQREGNPVLDYLPELSRARGFHGHSILSLLVSVAEDKDARQRMGKLYEEGLDWLLEELSEKYVEQIPRGHEVLKVDARRQVALQAEKASRKERAKRAQARMTAYMNSQVNSFALSEVDTMEEDEDAVAEDDGTSLESGAKACIMCHERTGQPLGYIGFAQRSTVLAQAIEQAPRNAALQKRYTVMEEVKVKNGVDADAAVAGHLSVGVEVLVEEKRGQLARISSPLAGWVALTLPNGKSVLQSEKDLAWQSWGRPRIVVGFCGHGVHQDCWDSYYATLQQVRREIVVVQ